MARSRSPSRDSGVCSLHAAMETTRQVLDEIIAHSRDDVPDECCGLVGGRDGRLTTVYRARNAEASPLRYSVHPQDQFRIMEAIEAAGEELVGDLPLAHQEPGLPVADRHQPGRGLARSRLSDLLARRPGGARGQGVGRSATVPSTRSSLPSADGTLVCPRCGRGHASDARMCERCAMPLVHAEGDEQAALGEAHEQARKIHPRYAKGELIRVAVARNLSEAELIKGMLLEQGIPSLIRRTAGFDVPDFLAAGPRDVLVPEAGVEEARFAARRG